MKSINVIQKTMTKHSPLCQEKQIILQEKRETFFGKLLQGCRDSSWQLSFKATHTQLKKKEKKNTLKAKSVSIQGIRMPIQDDT